MATSLVCLTKRGEGARAKAPTKAPPQQHAEVRQGPTRLSGEAHTKGWAAGAVADNHDPETSLEGWGMAS
jgi:hypothetical protein